jgi:hypothetical protein
VSAPECRTMRSDSPRAMKHNADRWNRRQPSDSFRITMNVDDRPRHVFLPPADCGADAAQDHLPHLRLPLRGHRRGFFLSGLRPANPMFSQSIAVTATR